MTDPLDGIPRDLYELREELQHWPELTKALQENDLLDFGECIGHLASFVGLALHGEYTQTDILGICNLITRRLQKKRELRDKIIYRPGTNNPGLILLH